MNTTKEDSPFHGLGIKSVTNIVEKHGGVFKIEQKENRVTSVVMIPNYVIV